METWSTCARQLIIPFTYTINPSSLFKVHPTGKAHFGSFLLQSKVDGSMDVQMAYHISIWGCSESILLQVTNQSMHVRCCWVGRSWAFYLLVLLRPSCFVRVIQINFPPRNCPHINVAKASPNLFLVENFHDTIYRRVWVKVWWFVAYFYHHNYETAAGCAFFPLLNWRAVLLPVHKK